jgi:hypothetical protein
VAVSAKITLSDGTMPPENAGPVLAALPDETHVAAWADLAGGSLDIALRRLDFGAGALAPCVRGVVSWIDQSDSVLTR